MLGSSNDTDVDNNRRRLLAALGGSASVALAGCSALLDDDEEVDDDDDDDDPDDDDPDEEEGRTNADKAQAAWERAASNPLPEDQDIRDEAYIEIEEAVRDDMVMLPLYHNLEERFWYDYVDVPLTGVLGGHHQVHNETTVDGDDELSLINSTFNEIDPIMSTDTASSEVIHQIYENLVTYPNGVPEIENVLLDDFDVSEDGTTWTFFLEEGVEYHDGGEVTADDVKFSWRRSVESEFTERAAFTLDPATGLGLAHEGPDDTGITVLDDYTLEIELVNPNPDVLDIITYSSFAVMPEGYVGDIEGYDGEVTHDELRTEEANGTGPFEFDFFEPDEEARVERFDGYHGETAEIESIHWTIIEDDDALWTFALEQNADIFGIPTQFYDQDAIDASEDDRGREVGTYGPTGELDEEVNYLAVAELSTFYFGMNASNVPKEVRQAVAYVTDHEELIRDVFAGRGVEAFSFLPPGLWPTGADGYDDWVDAWPYDANETNIEAAREVLEDGGYTEDDPAEVTLTTYEDAAFEEAAEQTRDKLAGTGVDIDLEQDLFGNLQDRGEDGDLEIYSLGWIWSWESPAYGHFSLEPRNTDTSVMPGETSGFYLDWHTELEEEA